MKEWRKENLSQKSQCIYCNLTIMSHNLERHNQSESHNTNIRKEIDKAKNIKLIAVQNKQNVLGKQLFNEMNIKLFFKDKPVSYYFPKHKNQI